MPRNHPPNPVTPPPRPHPYPPSLVRRRADENGSPLGSGCFGRHAYRSGCCFDGFFATAVARAINVADSRFVCSFVAAALFASNVGNLFACYLVAVVLPASGLSSPFARYLVATALARQLASSDLVANTAFLSRLITTASAT
ncbi:hypothetical protein CU254_33615 [Amycolatopsis sp. AA4]|nr:hypothetical protein CU254_33615 [Amycolatopsis sp. AA4]